VDQARLVCVKQSQFDGAEVNIPESVSCLLEADKFTGQGLTETDMVVFP